MKQKIQRIEKMKRLSLLCLLTLAVMGIWAEGYTIGTGTESLNRAPVDGNNEYSWSRMIYTAAEINSAGLGTASQIAGIGFQLHTPLSNYSFTNQRIFLRHTNSSAYTSNVGPDSTGFSLVYAGEVTFQDGDWQQLAFTEPFQWNGSQNIEILWKNLGGNRLIPAPLFRFTSTGTELKLAYNGAIGAFPTGSVEANHRRPNLQLITPMSPEPAVTVYPGDGGYALSGSRLIWKSGGGCPTSYSVHFGTVDPPPLISPGQTYPWYQPELEAGETYYWQIVPSNAYGTVSLPPVWSFRVPELGQLCENFENELPPGWLNPGSWDFPPDQYYPYHGTKCAQVRAGAAGNLLATPKLQLTSESTLEFMALSNAAPGSAGFRVKRSSDGTNWNEVAILPAISAANVWQRFELDLGSLAGQSYHLGIEAYNAGSGSNPLVFLDHVVGPRPVGVYPSPEVSISRRDNGFRLSWESPGGVTGYRVFAADDVDSFGEEALAELSASQTFFDVPTGNRKFFRVTAIY
ncbi:MAG: choice-of-anchor J domain-containing protein [Candidatus Cloacimonadota bacterium]|nr:choice-of-anchor J domain-containing protein [Candidatus Cloacimonadota bacterium]